MSAANADGNAAVDALTEAAMDHATIDDEQVVDRYLMGRLPREEAERFERHYLSCQRCLDHLELGEKLLAGLRHTAAREVERAGAMAAVAAALRRLGGWRAPLAALALSGLLLPSALLYQQLREASGELDGLRTELGAPRVNLPLLTLSPRRGDSTGAEPSHRLRLPAAPGSMVLALELDLPAGTACRAVLLDDAGQPRWRGDDLLADPAGQLVLGFPTTFLPPGDHLLRIEDAASGEPLAHFPLRVLPPR